MLSQLENKVHPQQMIPELRKNNKYDMNRMVSRMKRVSVCMSHYYILFIYLYVSSILMLMLVKHDGIVTHLMNFNNDSYLI